MEPLPHVDQLVNETRRALLHDTGRRDGLYAVPHSGGRPVQTSFFVPGGQYEFRAGAFKFGLHSMSRSVLPVMRFMHSIFGRPELSFDSTGRALPVARTPGTGPMLGRFVQVYCDDIRVLITFPKTREEHLVHVRMVLETLRHHKLYAKASKCQFGRSSVGFLGHVISERGVAVDPRKVAAVAEWATPTSCTDVRRFVGLANYYRKFVLRFSALAAPLTALCSPRAQFTRAGQPGPGP